MMQPPPPTSTADNVPHDIDFRLPPPPITEKGDEDLRASMYNVPMTVLDAPAMSDLENLLVSVKKFCPTYVQSELIVELIISANGKRCEC